MYGFTFDPLIGEFILSHPNIRIPDKGKIYSFNEGNYQVGTGGSMTGWAGGWAGRGGRGGGQPSSSAQAPRCPPWARGLGATPAVGTHWGAASPCMLPSCRLLTLLRHTHTTTPADVERGAEEVH